MNENYILGGQYQNNYTREEAEQFTAVFDQITQRMIDAMLAGESYDSEAMQQAVQEHFDFCNRFWSPSADAYKSLALSFILPTEYRENYEQRQAGLGKYIYDAICYFAETKLS